LVCIDMSAVDAQMQSASVERVEPGLAEAAVRPLLFRSVCAAALLNQPGKRFSHSRWRPSELDGKTTLDMADDLALDPPHLVDVDDHRLANFALLRPGKDKPRGRSIHYGTQVLA
jgi:hypothetical protein